ncbi:hypothetical protein [Litorimonas sp.]|uniref:hypothetical protein n=1 Tax=Litorimonas sp. TaxID=1892381 RepID=UPI003A840184
MKRPKRSVSEGKGFSCSQISFKLLPKSIILPQVYKRKFVTKSGAEEMNKEELRQFQSQGLWPGLAALPDLRFPQTWELVES